MSEFFSDVAEGMKCSLEAIDLACVRNDRLLFEKLSFRIEEGDALFLEGENGSGKTSLLRLLCGFRNPDSGKILWCGKNVQSNRRFRADMAYVGHSDGVKKELTVGENLRTDRALGLTGRYPLEQALEEVGLRYHEEVLVQSLSAGQKRRAAFARLLATDNKLWILDEPFTALDKDGIRLFERLMSDHLASGGMIVLSSHQDIASPHFGEKRIRLDER
ncbi:MAG: cytochrome c biogenesis heme-transporting ATPase CcmA [Gammaproteobacteria bacterium]